MIRTAVKPFGFLIKNVEEPLQEELLQNSGLQDFQQNFGFSLRTIKNKDINADQNGALNILRKVVGDSEFSRIVGSGHSLCPIRYRNPFQTVAGSM